MKKCETCGKEFTEVLPYGGDAKPQPATPEDRFCSGLCQLEYDATAAGMSMYDYVRQSIGVIAMEDDPICWNCGERQSRHVNRRGTCDLDPRVKDVR